MNNQMLTVQKVANLLGVSRGTVDNWTELGILPHPRMINGCRRWHRASLEQWAAEGESVPRSSDGPLMPH